MSVSVGKLLLYISVSQSGQHLPPGSDASLLGAVTHMWMVGGGNTKLGSWGLQCSSYICYHGGRIDEDTPGQFSFTNP